jgi:hypothetical protein
MGESQPALQLQGIRKSFNQGTAAEAEVLHGIDLLLERSSSSPTTPALQRAATGSWSWWMGW